MFQYVMREYIAPWDQGNKNNHQFENGVSLWSFLALIARIPSPGRRPSCWARLPSRTRLALKKCSGKEYVNSAWRPHMTLRRDRATIDDVTECRTPYGPPL